MKQSKKKKKKKKNQSYITALCMLQIDIIYIVNVLGKLQVGRSVNIMSKLCFLQVNFIISCIATKSYKIFTIQAVSIDHHAESLNLKVPGPNF